MKPPKQISIDNGQIGGAIQIIIQSMFIFNLFTFINTCIIVYTSFLHDYLSPLVAIALIITCAFAWWIFYYCIIYPSIIRFANRQSYNHGSPFRRDLDKIQKDIDEIKELLK